MKKFLAIFSVVALMLVLMPIKADAAAFVQEGDLYKSDSAISMGRFGTIATGDMTFQYTDVGQGIKKWEIYLTPNAGVSAVYFKLAPVGLTIQSVQANTAAFVLESNTTVDDGNNVLFLVTNPNGLTSGQRILLATITTKEATKDCVLNVSPLELDCIKVGNTYFNSNGKTITEAEFAQVCSKEGPTTPTTPDVPNDEPNDSNPDTGNVIPYFAIGGGLLAIALVFLYSKKANKMYKL